jgi:peptide methionine sulfoxide reductase msrA/msrB
MIIKTASLPPGVLTIVKDKGTEKPFFGSSSQTLGTYLCRQCGLALFRADAQFASGCGWPSFDESILNSILYQPDMDQLRTEILCKRCQAHLGHIFKGEGFTQKNTRYCVNSLSLDFVHSLSVQDTEEAIFAAGCFWGVEYWFQKLPGVVKTEVGYTGGTVLCPTYQAVCAGQTGHYEAIRVVYDIQQLHYEQLVKYFFEIHDFTQKTLQGQDLGFQYLSRIFYYDFVQKKISLAVIEQLKNKGHEVCTEVLPVSTFWSAENDHQQYYQKKSGLPYCHFHVKKF